MLELMARSGMRVGEVLKLTSMDIEDRKAIARDPKSGKEAEAVFPPQKVSLQQFCTYQSRKILVHPGHICNMAKKDWREILAMKAISRRQFLYISASSSMAYPVSLAIASSNKNRNDKDDRFPITISILKIAYVSENKASVFYDGYCRKAIKENYPNIAYLFRSFSVSEKIHAENYKRILTALRADIEETKIEPSISGTKANLIKASENELLKIQKTYPDFLVLLRQESYDKAITSCMYSWKSHLQHQRKIREIRKYSQLFFGSVAKKIETMKMYFHVCEICGSTISEEPKTPCKICNYSNSHYKKIERPF